MRCVFKEIVLGVIHHRGRGQGRVEGGRCNIFGHHRRIDMKGKERKERKGRKEGRNNV